MEKAMACTDPEQIICSVLHLRFLAQICRPTYLSLLPRIVRHEPGNVSDKMITCFLSVLYRNDMIIRKDTYFYFVEIRNSEILMFIFFAYIAD